MQTNLSPSNRATGKYAQNPATYLQQVCAEACARAGVVYKAVPADCREHPAELAESPADTCKRLGLPARDKLFNTHERQDAVISIWPRGGYVVNYRAGVSIGVST